MVRLRLEWSEVFALTASNVTAQAPMSAGVYRLSSQRDDEPVVFYVGQAENLYERLRDHVLVEEPNDCIRGNRRDYSCYFRFAIVERQSDRDCAERSLYDHFQPECNLEIPPGEPCDINFV